MKFIDGVMSYKCCFLETILLLTHFVPMPRFTSVRFSTLQYLLQNTGNHKSMRVIARDCLGVSAG